MRKTSRITASILTLAMLLGLMSGIFTTTAGAAAATISNKSLSAVIGDLGQIEVLNIKNNRTGSGGQMNFVLPNNTNNQNNTAHQWMGEMIFSYRTNDSGLFPNDRTGFVEVDTNRTLAAGGSTTYSNATANLANNPYIRKTVVSDKKVEINFIGQDESSSTARTMKGFDVKSVFNMETDDGSMLWEITLANKGSKYIEFGDVGLPMPWNNKYSSINDTYNNRVTVHTFAGADSGYAYAIRCSGEGNYMLFTPVVESGARIEYIDNWVGNNNGVTGERTGSLYANWTGDGGGWQPGLCVYYLHSKDISKTGRGYFTDSSSLVLAPGESKTYQFKFSAIRAGDNDPQESAASPNNASDAADEREANLRSILYKEGMIDAVAVPSFQTAINMPAKLDLHYDDSLISDVKVDILCVHENDPFDAAHIPTQTSGRVNNSRTGRGLHDGNPDYQESCTFVETKIVNGEQHHIYDLSFGCIGNNSVRVDYKLKVGDEYVDKFTQFEFNALAEIDEAVNTHSKFMLDNQVDKDPSSPTYGIISDWYFASGKDSAQKSHWGDDWSHDNINFLTMKNFLNPVAEEVEACELYLKDFMWENYMKYSNATYHVANYLSASGIYAESAKPYSRTFSEMMEATAFFNMYRIQKTYPNLIQYREPATWYLEKAYGIYTNRVGTGATGFYGEQQIPDMIEALKAEGMTAEAANLQTRFAQTKGRNMANSAYPYGSEFVYDNTGEEGVYAASKALTTYYPNDSAAAKAYAQMKRTEGKTRAMRGIQPTWYHYADPVFLGGESWWNFQYTASLAGSITDDWLRYQDNGWDTDQMAWAQRLNYGAKISNLNAINMGQIASTYVGNVGWRYTMYKGGHGAMNVYDGGTRVMNNGWNDFSGEADEGLYGSLLRMSADVVTDPVFGLFGYGCLVSKENGVYTVLPKDGIGKRINILDEKRYLTLVQDQCTQAEIAADGSSYTLSVNNLTKTAHLSSINLDGAGVQNGFYSIKLDDQLVGQCFIKENAGTVSVMLTDSETATITIEKIENGTNQAPAVSIALSTETPQAVVPFTLNGIAIDDGAPNGILTYKWEVLSAPEGATLTLSTPTATATRAVGTKAGEYKVKLTVSDGELEGFMEKTLTLGEAPSRLAPTIGAVSAVQGAVNKSVVALTGEATPDPMYNSELAYEWRIISQPEGANAIIGNVDSASAFMKVSQTGSYTVRFTAIDADVSAYKDVTIEVTGNVDGIDRAISVVTHKGTAPVLPAVMDVIYSDGSYGSANVVWDEIDPALYAESGDFEVEGSITGADMKALITVYVANGASTNIALAATPSAIINSVNDLGGVKGLNDGYDPASSSSTTNGVWHNWLGDQGGPAWVRYDWSEPFLATAMDVYVFRDGGGNFQPKDMQLTLRDEAGNWYTPRAVSGLGNTLNKYNTTTFEPAYITGMRIDMKPVSLGCGIIEWKVYGHTSEELADKTELKEMIAITELYKSQFFTAGYSALTSTVTQVKAVLANSKATQEEVDGAVKVLSNAIYGLSPLNGNIAFAARPTTSFVSSWESINAVNDNITSGSPHYGSWGNTSRSEWVAYTWPTGAEITSADLWIWNDGGGIKTPTATKYEYMDKDGVWHDVPNPVGLGLNPNASNVTTFDTFEAKSLRVTMTKPSNNSEGVGLMEWRVQGKLLNWGGDESTGPVESVVKDALAALIEQAEALNAEDYSAESWQAMQEALDTARTVMADDNATQDDVDTASGALESAMDALEPGEPEIIPVSKIKIDASALFTLSIKKKAQIPVIIEPDDASNPSVKWISTNENIFTVDEDGNITPKKQGTATLTAISSNGLKSTIIVRITA